LTHARNVAVCIFGSVARDQNDCYSDKDILIISDKKLEALEVIEKWAEEGWSVAFYTWERLAKMARIGSLFIQHLKQDGIIKSDPSLKLSKLLSEYEPKKDYGDVIEASKDMARPLDRTPKEIWETQMQCDVLYTFTRNSGILELASHGKYQFDYTKIIKHLANLHSLNNIEIESLLNLRSIKAQYRARKPTVIDCSKYLKVAKNTVSKIFNEKFLEIDSHNPIRFLNVPYGTLRDIEARLISYYQPDFLDQLSTGTFLDVFWASIIDPRQYSWSIKTMTSRDITTLNKSISDIVNFRASA